ncbi:MAG: putative toxin-antitoxin system toxin component, PIN family [Candidatus Omnitrophota bacterium]
MDTNVLVSGMLTPFGVCGEIVRMLTTNSFTICVDSRILFEYEDVLRRSLFKIKHNSIDVIMEYIESVAEVYNASPLPASLPDPGDEQFLEVAISGNVDCLVTGNVKHFPRKLRNGIQVVSLRKFLDVLKSRQNKHSISELD